MRGTIHRWLRKAFHGEHHTCPRWICFTFDNPLRRLLHPAPRILRPFVAPGDRVLDLGPGIGYFTLPLARIAGPQGAVVAADIQPRMLDALARRAARRGVTGIRTAVVGQDPARPLDALDPDERFDFILMFWMLHEVRDRDALLRDARRRLSPRGAILVAEPLGHVPPATFDREIAAAEAAGLTVTARPPIALSRTALLRPAGRPGSS